MRFVWKQIKRDTGIPIPHEQLAMQAASESQEAVQDAEQNRAHLKGYLERTEKVTPQEKKQFNDQLTEWYKRGDKVNMRMGGVSESENDKDYLTRHARLSSAFVKWDKKSKRIAGSVNFTNDTAEHKVGLGDVLPPIVKVVKVKKKNGEIVDCVRTQNPRTGRIGYYETGSLSKGKYAYVAIHSGDSFEVMRTVDPKDPKAQRDILREHVMVYRGKAMEADEGEETYYDGYGKPLKGSPGAKRAKAKARVQSGGAKRRAGFQKALGSLGVRPSSQKSPKKQTVWSRARAPKKGPKVAPRMSYGGQTVEVAGKRYQKLTRSFLEQFIGTTPEKTSRWLVPTSFLGQSVKVNPMVLPYLKEAESRIKAAGIDFKIKRQSGDLPGCQCYNHRGIRKRDGTTSKTLSKHSFGIAFDINPDDHPFGTSWAENNNPDKMPMEMVKIMQDCGFRWGDGFKNRDPMHFELAVNPFTSQDIIKSNAGKEGLATLENFAGGLGGQTREAWAKARKGGSNERVASAPLKGNIRVTNTTKARSIVDDYNFNAQGMKLDLNGRQESMINNFFQTFEAHRADYDGVSEATGLPAILIAIIHFRESSMRFDRYLHNGQKLGKTTTYVPKGILFHQGQWKEAAIHALGGNISDANGKPSLKAFRSLKNRLGINAGTTDMGKIMAFCEFYNGLGYRKKGRTSPYAVAGTNLDMGGMYVADGKFNPNKKDPRVGAGAILLAYNDRTGSPVMKPGEALA